MRLSESLIHDLIWDNLPLGAKKLMRETNSSYYVVNGAHAIAEKMRKAENAKCTDCAYRQDIEAMKDIGV